MSTAFKPANILIPENTDMEKWAVVACDQYTGQPDYWKRVEDTVGAADSTLKLILPEVYLEDSDSEERIKKIHAEMDRILSGNTLKEYKDTIIYIESWFFTIYQFFKTVNYQR